MLQKNKILKEKIFLKGFTLIEILLVIGIISILASVIIVAINPARQFAQTRNTQRWSNVNTILNAVNQYVIDNNGSLPSAIPTTTSTEICKTGAASCTSLIDLSVLTNSAIYITSMPVDPFCPTGCSAEGAGYTIFKDANGRVVVSSPNAELGKTVSITR